MRAKAGAGSPQQRASNNARTALLWWLLPTLAVAQTGAESADTPVPIRLGLSVLKIEVLRDAGGYALGSAVVVAPGEVLTNCHVTREAWRVNVLYIGLRWTAVAQAADIGHDLCLLKVPSLPAAPVEVGSSAGLQVNQRVDAIGYSGGMRLQATAGQVLALHPFDGGQVVQSSNWFVGGASGGGLFDAQQRLVGVLTFRLPGGAAHYFAAPAEWLEALRRQPMAAIAPLPGDRLAFWQQPPDRQPDFLRRVVAPTPLPAPGATPPGPRPDAADGPAAVCLAH